MKIKIKRPLKNTKNNNQQREDRVIIVEVMEKPTKPYRVHIADFTLHVTEDYGNCCITKNVIWVNKTDNEYPFATIFDSKDDADEFIDNLRKAVEEYNYRIDGKPKEQHLEDDEEIIG